MEHRMVQQMAKETLAHIRDVIRPGMSLREVRRICESKLLEMGADSFWYHDVGAFVFSGVDTVLSVSGRDYETADRKIETNDVVTIDLSPQASGVWGDYARTIVLESGAVISDIGRIRNMEWREALEMEQRLHDDLLHYASPDITFEQLFHHANGLIRAHGYENLDFMSTLGHSIVRRREDRIYIERGNSCRLGEVEMFTFEPHIRRKGARYGVKMENIYYFEDGRLLEL